MERSTIFHGKIHYFDGAIFNSKLYVYQRVTCWKIDEKYGWTLEMNGNRLVKCSPTIGFVLWKWMIILTAHEIDWLNHPATNWMIRCWKVAEPADPGSTLGRLEAAIRCGFSLFSQIHTCLNRGNTEHPQVSLIMCYLLTIVTIVTISNYWNCPACSRISRH